MCKRLNLTDDEIARSTRQAGRLEKADNARLERLLHSPRMSTTTEKTPITSEEFEEYVAIDTTDAMWENPDASCRVRGKDCLDGCKSLSEAVERLNEYAEFVQALIDEGFELDEEITYDWGYAVNPTKAAEIEAEVRADLLESYEVVDDTPPKLPDLDNGATIYSAFNGLPTPMMGDF